jgi:ATP-dependent helicase HepA
MQDMNPTSFRPSRDPLGWREELRQALAQPALAAFNEQAGVDDPLARRAAYQVAACLGKCRLFGVELAELDGTLSAELAAAATEQWSAYLGEWIHAAGMLPQAWSEAAEEVEALDYAVDLLTARMECWEVFLAVDEAHQESVEVPSPAAPRLRQTLRFALDAQDRFDQVLRQNADYLALVAGTELLANWRSFLAADYRHTFPWWLDGSLEELLKRISEEFPGWLPGMLIKKTSMGAASNPLATDTEAEGPDQPVWPTFAPGQLVALKSEPSIVGAILSAVGGIGEPRYLVFCTGRTTHYYASQLIPALSPQPTRELLTPAAFNASMTSLHLQQPGLSSLYSLHAARIDFVPYQFRPVLKFIRSDRPRLLIADSVGVGKTIEAGLILRELQARRDVRSVLIVCPKSLVVERKWEMEMRRFDEEFVPLDGKALQHCLREMDSNGEWPDRFAKAIMPYSLFNEALLLQNGNRRRNTSPGLLELNPPPRFDLVIVDEAHYLHNPETDRHKGVRFLTDNAEAAVFLTASPIQLESDNLFVLLNMLRPDLVIDRRTYQDMAEPNPYINQAAHLLRFGENGWQGEAAIALDQAADTRWGRSVLRQDPRYLGVQRGLRGAKLKPADRVRSLRTVEELHTFNGLINRTRRRDIEDFTIRKAYTRSIDFTEPQRSLHDRILNIQGRLFQLRHGDVAVKFLMTTIRRRAASCIHGLMPFLRDLLQQRVGEVELYEMGDDDPRDLGVGDSFRGEIDQLIAEAGHLDTADPKLDCLLAIIRDKQPCKKNKVLLFSSFRHTLRYLETQLQRNGVRIGLVHGGVSDEDRVAIRARFMRPKDDPDALDVLLMSDVGAEGLDYQFCDCMVNYDLPWNPMKIDQRIGRIDRRGQTSKAVAIYNLITPGTVDADIYDRCLWRIGVFVQALGDNEEILGELTSKIRSVAEDLNLSEQERRRHLQQLADNQIHLLEEQVALEKRQSELFGVFLPPRQMDEEIQDPMNFWTSPLCLQNIVEQYLSRRAEGRPGVALGNKPLRTITVDAATRRQLHDDYRLLGRRPSAVGREWEKWLRGREPRLTLTFDAGAANENRSATFITPVHPLAQQAAAAMAPDGPVYLSCRVRSQEVPVGDRRFAIYLWQLRGIREDVVWQPVCSDVSLTDRLFGLLQGAEFREVPPGDFPSQPMFDSLDSEHHQLWTAALAAHKDRTRQLAGFLRESLRTSHTARMGLLNDQLEGVSDGRIRRMRSSQIQSAEEDYVCRLGELQRAEDSADIIAHPVAFGLLEIER